MVFFAAVQRVGSLLVMLALLFFFGHIWHGARTLFRDVFAGIDPDLDAQVEFGTFQKVGDPTIRKQAV
ncbi:hypothetical protein BRADI_3g23223v3 [Brachypodium distachyon]|uniref:Photosystem II CP47 chlorophyll apoprotein n=1 Tax=Brachypodium distachyon TaxID=15368 RepID=A0A0Q3LVY2_BRADI|nr:hypothetical protein BRADI_3g23223v3 [Brachypodium distachyon]